MEMIVFRKEVRRMNPENGELELARNGLESKESHLWPPRLASLPSKKVA